MKNSLVYGTVMAGQLAVAAIVLQGCKTYTPGSRSAFGGGTEMGTEEVREANVVNVDNTSEVSSEVSAKPIVSTPVVKTQVSSSKVGAPGTYKEFVLEPGAEDRRQLVVAVAGQAEGLRRTLGLRVELAEAGALEHRLEPADALL